MTGFSVERFPFEKASVQAWSLKDARHTNWPVVYLIDAAGALTPQVYVGETVKAAGRMHQHLDGGKKSGLRRVRVVLDDTFNKSVCLDLESHLIRWLAGDGQYEVLTGNEGINDADYYDRMTYRESFRDVFEQLRSEGVFRRTIPQIENSDLFKLSPFKALTDDQAAAVEDIVEGLLEDLAAGVRSRRPIVVQGDPGTGKTIVAIFLLKLLADIKSATDLEDVDPDAMFSEFFVAENRELLEEFRMALVIPQQSLRLSIKRVFRKTPGLNEAMVLSPYEVGESAQDFDLLIVDETHRLNQRANQSSGGLNKKFRDINVALFGVDDIQKTQLDWIVERSAHQILLVDAAQSVRPADLPSEVLTRLVEHANSEHRHYRLVSQMRVRAGADYVDFIRRVLRGQPHSLEPGDISEYDLRFFDDLGEMRDAILARDSEEGLARLVAGFAWDWKTKTDPEAFDIEIDGLSLRWNSADKDWINSAGSLEEVGSIHTVQGYDLNYAGVIVGPDLAYDPVREAPVFDRDSYRDKKGKENNPTLGKVYSDQELLNYVVNIYAVLLTRGIRGTYVYVCDPELRVRMRSVIRRVTGR